MSFQTRKNFVHLWNTNYDIFDEIRWLRGGPLTAIYLIKAPEGRKDNIKIDYIGSTFNIG